MASSPIPESTQQNKPQVMELQKTLDMQFFFFNHTNCNFSTSVSSLEFFNKVLKLVKCNYASTASWRPGLIKLNLFKYHASCHNQLYSPSELCPPNLSRIAQSKKHCHLKPIGSCLDTFIQLEKLQRVIYLKRKKENLKII